MTNWMIDNRTTKLVSVLKERLQADSELSLVLKSLSLAGFSALYDQLKSCKANLLLGIDDQSLTKRVACQPGEEKLSQQLVQKEQAAALLKWLQNNVTAKGVQSNRLVQNLFHIQNTKNTTSIQGSTDLTATGLGLAFTDRLDMAMGSTDPIHTESMRQWYNQHWQEQGAQDIQAELVSAVEFLATDQSPELVYFIVLYRLFEELLNEIDEDSIVNTRTGFKNTLIWNKLYPFQKDGVLGVIDKLERHNGCILADSVGLGKTFEALAVIKYYELRNARVLVLAPKKLRDNWTLFVQNDTRNLLAKDRFSYNVLNHSDLTRSAGMSGDTNLATLNWGNYDLVVIDESHNFRNASVADERHTRYSKLMDDIIRSGVKTKVLMLSATPVNNRLNDLKNQIAFATEGDDQALQAHGIENISNTLRQAQTRFNEWLKRPEESRTTEQLLNSLNFGYFKILDLLTIARSRKHIEKYYNLADIGQFPQRLKPINVKADFDTQNEFPSLKEINRIIERLNLSTFSPLKYVLMEKRASYQAKYDTKLGDGRSVFSQLDREKSLIGLIKVNLLKRLESSVHSFRLTTERLLASIDLTINKLEEHSNNELDSIDILDADIDSPELEALLVGSKVKVLIQDMDQAKWLYDLKEDRSYLLQLHNAANSINVQRDKKLGLLKAQIEAKIKQPLNPDNRKVLVFTAFADTAQYLYQHLQQWALDTHGLHSAVIVGSGSNKTNNPMVRTDFGELLTAFSPSSKERDKTGLPDEANIDLLFATDCISEGQNLQDCDYLINYDIHWNPVRIIQRFGRIDRLGSTNTQIQLINFWPNIELDEYIDLESRVSGRMVLLDVSATGEENLIDSDNEGRMRDLAYRRKQMQELQNNVPDLEDISGGLSITDLTLSDFKMDLANYRKAHESVLESAPNGLYSVARLDSGLQAQGVQPGVIFCLKSLDSAQHELQEPYALFPFYLVQVGQDGATTLPFNQAKKILDVLKRQCLGRTHANKELYVQAGNSKHYQSQLQSAIAHLQGEQQQQGIHSLFTRGGTKLAKTESSGNYEVVAFLILLEGN
ncbi:helicase-related protein [Orrella sp. 11846]|uniref:helicase-related protein n=1 Tax=Orrella sp. 11846 TaxID=3409913 RepID=UPI003B5C9E82